MKENLFIALIICCVMFLGAVIGIKALPTEKQVPISDRIQSCHEKGGRYSYHEYGYNNEEKCRLIEDEIKEF